MPFIPADASSVSSMTDTGLNLSGTHPVDTFDLADTTTDKVLFSISENGGCDVNIPTIYHMSSNTQDPLTVLDEEGDHMFSVSSQGTIFTMGTFIMHNVTLTTQILGSLVTNYMELCHQFLFSTYTVELCY